MPIFYFFKSKPYHMYYQPATNSERTLRHQLVAGALLTDVDNPKRHKRVSLGWKTTKLELMSKYAEQASL